MTNYYNSLCNGRDTVHKKTKFGASGGSPNTTKTSRWWLASLFMIMSLFMGQFVNAQVSAYSFTQTTGTYTAITGTTLATPTGNSASLSLDSFTSAAVTLPFTFSYNATNVTTAYMNSNGFLSLGATAPGSGTLSPISTTSTATGIISPWGGDLNTFFNLGGRTGSMSWTTEGTAPNRVIVFQWRDFRPSYNTSATNAFGFSFQVRLTETTNNVQIVYGPASFAIGSTAVTFTTASTTTGRQIGLRGATTADFNNRIFSSFASASTAGTTAGNGNNFNTSTNFPANGLTLSWNPPTCFAPSVNAVTTFTNTTATLSWNAPTVVPANGYIYEVRTSGAAGSGATGLVLSGTTSSTSENITGLTANTSYFVYLRSDCGSGDLSSWSSATTFFTGYCLASSTSAASWISVFNTTGGITNITHSAASGAAGGYLNLTASSVSNFIGNATSFSLTSGGPTVGNAIWVDWNNNLLFETSERVYQSLTYGTTVTGSFSVPAATPNGSYRMRVLTDFNVGSPINPCGNISRGEYKDFTFEVVDAPAVVPSCASALNPADLSSDLAKNLTLSWTAATGFPTSYDVYLSTASGSTTPVANVTGTSYALTTPLAASTLYYWKIVPKNATGEATGCVEQSFTTGTSLNYCNTALTTTGGIADSVVGVTVGGYVSGAIGGAAPWYTAVANTPIDIVVPSSQPISITMGTDSGQHSAVWIDFNQNGVFEASENVALSTVSAGASAVVSYTLVIPSSATLGITRMRVRGAGDSAYTAAGACTGQSYGETEDYLINLMTPPPTPPNCATTLLPSDLSSDLFRNLTLSWTAATGFPTSYDVYLSTASGSTTPVTNVTGTSYTTPVLNANTQYFWSVIAKNEFGDAVGCAEQTFTTGALINYCTPTYTNGKTDGDLISNISISGTTLSNNSGTAATNPSYTFFNSLPNHTADLQAGSTYSVTVTVGTWGTQGIAAWIDYNDDGIFSPSEKIGNTAGTIGSGTGGLPIPANHTASFNISLSCNPPLGVHRMRVRDVFSTSGALIDPCLNYSYGETEDYLVNVTTADPCPTPKNLARTDITASGATLNWVVGCVETQWDVHIQLASDPAPTELTTPSNPGLTATTLVATGLNSNTAYNVYVRAVCDSGLGVYSAWSSLVTFTTQGVANCATALVPADLAVDIARNPTLSWTASVSNPAVTGYDVYFGDVSGAPLVSAAQTGLTYAPAFLAANTTYYWKVVAKNSIGDAVGCVEQSFTTGTTINYCTPIYSSGKTSGDLISNIAITGTALSNNSGTAATNPAYTFFTGLPNYTAELQAGGTYSVNVTVGTWGNQAVKAWIDYNDNGVFEASEVIGTSVIAPGQGNTGPFPAASFPISLSCDPPVGDHRLRVRSVWNVTAASIDPCTSSGFGETEDYVITITAPDPCPTPKNLAASLPTIDGATLNWVKGCDESEWDVAVQTPGSGTPTSATQSGLTEATYIATGLNSSTAYEYYVRAVCETGVLSSNWAGPFVFTTLAKAPGCTVLTSPADGATGISVGTIPFSWSAPAVSATEDAATSYDLYYGTSTTPGVANTLLGNYTTTSTNIILTGFNATFYVRIVPKNSGGVAVGPCTVTSFTTEADPFIPYCSSVTYTSGVEPISSVSFAGINNTSNSLLNGSPSIQNFIAISGNVEANRSYTMTLKGNTDGSFTSNFRVFIDWNQDGDFTDAGERYNAGSVTNSNGIDAISAVSTIAVPVNALPGVTRMRIKKIFGTTDIDNPCLGAGFGQTEDYTLNVTGFTTEVLSPICGSTLAAPNSIVGVRNFPQSRNVSSFRFKAVGPSGDLTVVKTTPHFQFSELVGWQFGTTYTVSCELQVNGVWAGYYGPTCTISTPEVVVAGLSQIVSPACNTVVRPNTIIATTSLDGVTSYSFEITNTTPGYSGTNPVQTLNKTINWFRLNQLPEYVYGSTYSVRVAIRTTATGAYGAFGPACTFSTTTPVIAQCATTVNAGSLISSTSLGGVTQYSYVVTNLSDDSVQTITRTMPHFPTSLITGYSSTTTYTVSVSVTSTGVQSPYTEPCEINASAPAARLVDTTSTSELKVQGFPNPFTNNFTLEITKASEDKVAVMVYDMIGKLLDRVEVNATDNTLELGANYPAGVYNVIVSQRDSVKSIRMIKR
jgi:hypothetical protein